MFITIMEYLSFGLSMLCVFCYGHSKIQGSIVGILCAISFIIWGLTAEVYAAIANVVFFILHGRNLTRALKERD